MADVRFDYPTAAAPTASLVFPQGGSLIGDPYRHTLNQSIEETRAKNPIVNRFGSGKPSMVFSLRCMRDSATEADRADVINFIDNVVLGATYSFQWTDEDGTVRAVKCLNAELEFVYFSGAYPNIVDICPLSLRVES